MQPLQGETLRLVREQMAAHPWRDEDLAELVAPTMGIISGLPHLLAQLEGLRREDLGTTPPAADLPVKL
ncbi:hypothetical protein [Rhodoligotrophos defluvii]|uniref:hypothetical protein n=1 Tax=Rhodoligotrophos defluvii TaxID=2561934 RepID=UPI0010CA04CF|nr:hypothetical protein [Rhodoligotrophos defluvii]